jgi:enamine deaminase RidA (YjgF/YER057c/UK114 family)
MIEIDTSCLHGNGNSFQEQLANIFSNYDNEGLTVRLVFFGAPSDNAEYLSHLQMIKESVHNFFGESPPVFSYVAQPPLEKGRLLVAEVHRVRPGREARVFYKRHRELPYLVIESQGLRSLYLSGARAISPEAGTSQQSDEIFSCLEDIFSLENMDISSITRQWNYIEKIVKTSDGHQHYQDFNESRSRFYGKTTWVNAYPAATGVGVSCAGVMIDLDALDPVEGEVEIVALNNSLQVPAHAYSPSVLIGKEDNNTTRKTTPKFERAKVVLSGGSGLVYVSGTAAIRGEMSLHNTGVEEQTRITLENIEHLISKETLAVAEIESNENARLVSLRVYLKNKSDFEKSKRIIDEKYADVPSVYLMGDVCREELLVEIEGFASLNNLKTVKLTKGISGSTVQS